MKIVGVTGFVGLWA